MSYKSPLRITASGIVVTGKCRIAGFFVASTTAGTLTLYDNTAASGTQISGVITPAAGNFYPFPVDVQNGLYATVGGTIDVTFLTDY